MKNTLVAKIPSESGVAPAGAYQDYNNEFQLKKICACTEMNDYFLKSKT